MSTRGERFREALAAAKAESERDPTYNPAACIVPEEDRSPADMTLTDFLLARIAENEERARDFEEDYARATIGQYGRGGQEWAVPKWYGVEQIGFLPARVLAECEAKRRIVEVHTRHRGYAEAFAWCLTCGRGEWPCETIRALAAVYADHPDYREEWRP